MRLPLAVAVVAAAAVPAAQAQQRVAVATAPPRPVAASYLDHAIITVQPVEKGLAEILIQDRGRAKAPVPVAITRVDGTVTRCGVPLDVFLKGSNVARFRVPARPAIVRVELDPDHEYPDADRSNDVWSRKP